MALSGGSRRAILSVAIGGVATLSECIASDDPDVVLEYSVSIGSEREVILEDARDHYGQDGYEWVVVEISVDEGNSTWKTYGSIVGAKPKTGITTSITPPVRF